ncbi:zinc finger CCCH domain-containing protein 12-like [Hibiscus syriacus]|uniref:Zinc finger CCCH domain-containing protein 12-like n=2 Tax=Hibiscus syriacus TaxID=106335 RepID=A0A6A2YJJ4_HIBSY|nr:zinc finger CCCH domain-containing protein 12-like [Hibiscus syriacus]
MKAAILRAGSVPVLSSALSGSPRVSLSRQGLLRGVFSGDSPIVSLHFLMEKRKPKETRSHLRRALSDTDIIRSEPRVPGGSRCFTEGKMEEEYLSDCEVDSEFRTEFGITSEEIGFSGDGFGTGGKFGSDHGGDSYGDKSQIGDYYREMLKLNPGDSLLLRNYGKFLHEVEKDMDGAEEYYGRAILASPGDGEVLSLYGKLIWERHRDESRAKSYFDRAITACPNDCMVLGSYAHFLWDAEKDDDEEVGVSRVMAAAF